MVLGAVLAGGHLEHIGSAEEGLLSVPVGDHLQCRYVDIENRYVDINYVDRFVSTSVTAGDHCN